MWLPEEYRVRLLREFKEQVSPNRPMAYWIVFNHTSEMPDTGWPIMYCIQDKPGFFRSGFLKPLKKLRTPEAGLKSIDKSNAALGLSREAAENIIKSAMTEEERICLYPQNYGRDEAATTVDVLGIGKLKK